MKFWLKSGLVGLVVGIVTFYISAIKKFSRENLTVYLFANTNNGVWVAGTLITHLLLFFVLGIFFGPLIKFTYKKIKG